MATATTHDQLKLSIVKIVHTMIYVMMASAVLCVFFCGLTGRRDQLLTVAASLVAFKGLIFPGTFDAQGGLKGSTGFDGASL